MPLPSRRLRSPIRCRCRRCCSWRQCSCKLCAVWQKFAARRPTRAGHARLRVLRQRGTHLLLAPAAETAPVLQLALYVASDPFIRSDRGPLSCRLSQRLESISGSSLLAFSAQNEFNIHKSAKTCRKTRCDRSRRLRCAIVGRGESSAVGRKGGRERVWRGDPKRKRSCN